MAEEEMEKKWNRSKVIAGVILLIVAMGALFYFVGRGWSEEATLAPKERIVFASSSFGRRWDIYTIATDGSELRKLTKDRNQKDNMAPSFSPDGSRIVFYSNRDGNWEIYTMNVVGGDVKRLTAHPRADAMGSYSPDGGKIVFHSYRSESWDIYVMNADGSEPRRLTDNPATDRQPAWSPDGKKIAFVSNRDGNDEIYVMNADGTDQKRLTENQTTDVGPKFSPDGTKIVFESDRGATVGQIWMMNADGSQAKALTNGGGGNPGCGWTETSSHRASFSADGTRIVYMSYISTKWCGPEIFVMNADGSNPRQISDFRVVPGEKDYTGRLISPIDFPSFSPVPVPAPAQ